VIGMLGLISDMTSATKARLRADRAQSADMLLNLINASSFSKIDAARPRWKWSIRPARQARGGPTPQAQNKDLELAYVIGGTSPACWATCTT
jgi:hypothetical protein